jgi:hypothetical protein
MIMDQLMKMKSMKVSDNCTCIVSPETSLGLRIEWMKSRAHADRWSEEVVLLEEEMRRVLCFLDWKTIWWIHQGSLRQKASVELREGCAAYAAKQAGILRNMALSFAKKWLPLLEGHSLSVAGWPDWIMQYQQVSSFTPEVVIDETLVRDDDYDEDTLL